MATLAQGKEILQSMKDLAKAAKSFKAIVDQALGHNSAISINWGDLANDLAAMNDYLVASESVSGADISNALGSFAAFQTYWGTHGGNLEKFAQPIV